MEINLSGIFKSYDIRGVYPDQINADMAYKIAQAYVKYVGPKGKIAVGRDVRTSSPELHAAVIRGLADAGVGVADIGEVSTDMYYFAVGHHKLAGGIQVTASHNPAEYNGIKMVREAVYPLFGEKGIRQIRDLILNGEWKVESKTKGRVEKKDVWADFADCVLSFIDDKKIKALKIVINPNFGLQGRVIKYIVSRAKLPITLIGLNDEPDGTFPKGRPDPFVPENRPEFVELVKSSGADFGVAWDADGDRVFFCTEKGDFVESYYTNALLYGILLDKNNGGKVIYDPRYTWALVDSAKEHGGDPLIERVGHSYIKARMKKEDALICGESSGHTYFRDFWYADSGIIPALMIMELVSVCGKTMGDLVEPLFVKYPISGEINSTVQEAPKILEQIEKKYADSAISKIDGLSIEYPDWRANIRTSNTEPLMRLNVEGKSQKIVDEKRDELLAIIRKT